MARTAIRAYTAAGLAAKALLLLKESVDLPSTHGGLVQIFGREQILSGKALYDTTVKAMTAADAQPVIDLAREMLDPLQRKLSQLPKQAAEA